MAHLSPQAELLGDGGRERERPNNPCEVMEGERYMNDKHVEVSRSIHIVLGLEYTKICCGVRSLCHHPLPISFVRQGRWQLIFSP